jgi:hypothetical protein
MDRVFLFGDLLNPFAALMILRSWSPLLLS